MPTPRHHTGGLRCRRTGWKRTGRSARRWSPCKSLAAVRRAGEGCAHGDVALAKGATGRGEPGNVHLTPRSDGDVRTLVAAHTADLHRRAEGGAMVGRAREDDLVAAAAVEVRPRGVNVAVRLVDLDAGLVVEAAQAENIRGQDHCAHVARAVRGAVVRV